MIRVNLLHISKPAPVVHRTAPVVTTGLMLLLLSVFIMVLMIAFLLTRSFLETERQNVGMHDELDVVCGKVDEPSDADFTGESILSLPSVSIEREQKVA